MNIKSNFPWWKLGAILDIYTKNKIIGRDGFLVGYPIPQKILIPKNPGNIFF